MGAAGVAGGGGGLSATTIALAGTAIAGGAVVATQVLADESSGYGGSFQMTTVQTRRAGSGASAPVICISNLAISGSLRIEDFPSSGSDARGHFIGDWTETASAGNCPQAFTPENDRIEGDFSGPAASVQFTRTFNGGGVSRTRTFNGSVRGDAIVGTWTMSFDFTSPTANSAGVTISEAYPATTTP